MKRPGLINLSRTLAFHKRTLAEELLTPQEMDHQQQLVNDVSDILRTILCLWASIVPTMFDTVQPFITLLCKDLCDGSRCQDGDLKPCPHILFSSSWLCEARMQYFPIAGLAAVVDCNLYVYTSVEFWRVRHLLPGRQRHSVKLRTYILASLYGHFLARRLAEISDFIDSLINITQIWNL